jgi:O-antigen ligase
MRNPNRGLTVLRFDVENRSKPDLIARAHGVWAISAELSRSELIRTSVVNFFDRPGRARNADGMAAAVAVSLPWSTSATGVLVVFWLAAVIPTLELRKLRTAIMGAAGALPLILVALAAIGMLWADVSWRERLHGLEGFSKLLFIPFLLAQFHGSRRGSWVIFGFLGSTIALLAVSWGLGIRGEAWPGKPIGVPVKDYMFQSGMFALCAFGLAGYAAQLWRSGRTALALAAALTGAIFVLNIAFVATSRTTLLVTVVLALLFGFRRSGAKGMVATWIIGCLLAGTLWVSSPFLRQRVTDVAEEIQSYRTEHAPTSSGLRLEYWKNSMGAVAKAPIFGHGTGTIEELLRTTAPPETGTELFSAKNPHNEIFIVALQLGMLGTIVLCSMWLAHLALFRGDGLIQWIGLIVVVENVVGSLFNSHLHDFGQGWLYVFAVGVLGGMVLQRPENSADPASG